MTILRNYSLEITGKDGIALQDAAALIPPGTNVNVTFLGNEDLDMRIAASTAVLESGLRPVPHISARRLTSEEDLRRYLGALREIGASDRVFVVGGDPAESMGPYSDSLAVIRSGLLGEYGTMAVSISGYPEGHPDIPDPVLWQALEDKAREAETLGLELSLTTQFGFDVDPVLVWLERLRGRGISAPVRLGVPGPAGIKRLLGYAKRFGVSSSAGIVQKYGMSLTNLLGTAGPGKFLSELESRLDAGRHGAVLTHFYTFGGITATAAWVRDNDPQTAV